MDMTDRAAFAEDGTEAGDCNRRRQRDSLFLTAAIAVAGGPPQDVRIRNLSAEGLMAELGRAVEPGTAVTLDLRGIGTVSGQVAWSTEGRIGITLNRPIDPKLARKPVGNGTSTPFYAKPLVSGLR